MNLMNTELLKNGMKKNIETFNELLKLSDYNLNQFIKGDSVVFSENTPEELFDKIKVFIKEFPYMLEKLNTEEREQLWVEFKQLENYEKINRFINWLERYAEYVRRPLEDAAFIQTLSDEQFKNMTTYCFENLILQDIGKKLIDQKWDVPSMLKLRKIMFTYVDMIVMENYAQDNAVSSLQEMFGISSKRCTEWWELIKANEEKLWKIMFTKRHSRIEKKLNTLLEMLEE